MLKSIILILVSSWCIFVNANATDNPKSADPQKSTLFKMSRNSNRLSLFENIQSTFKVKKGAAVANVAYTTRAEVEAVLGAPNVKVNTNTIAYTLNPTNGCKAIIEFDEKNNLTLVVVKDCN